MRVKKKRVKRKAPRKRTMARRRKATRRRSITKIVRRGASRKTGSKIVSTIKPMATGIGGGLITETAVNQVAPQYAQIAGYGGSYLFGGVKGVLGKVAFDLLSGRGIGFGGFGGAKPTEVGV